MSQLSLKRLEKSFNDSRIIKGIDLEVAEGEFVVFVGPSGCGKSTLLRMIAGLEDVTEGQIEISGKVVNDLPPVQRGIAMVFQSYALYPHMTVYENIAFPLRVEKLPQDEVDRRVSAAAKVLQLEPRLKHRPGQLSGGQRQRVAIGRAIVRQPRAFLFDEPLVWVGSPQFEVWRRDPLPIAVYESTSMARQATLAALGTRRRGYHLVYHSPSLAGQLAAVESGLAVAVLTRCSVPAHLQILQNLPDEFELPPLDAMHVGVLRSKVSQRQPAVNAMYEQIVRTLG